MVNRRDVLLCLKAGLPADAVADLCGYSLLQEEIGQPVEQAPQPLPEFKPGPKPVSAPDQPLTLLAAVRAEIRPEGFDGAGPEADLTQVWAKPLSDEEIRVKHGPPPMEPLMPLARLWPWLHQVLGRVRPSRNPDVPRTLKLVTSGAPLLSLPRKPMLRWAPRVRIIVDRSLPPGFIDQDVDILCKEVERLHGRQGLLVEKVRDKKDRDKLSAKPIPTLVVSDLGQLRGSVEWAAWWSCFAHRLQAAGVRPVALVPCPRDLWSPEHTDLWTCACWDRHEQVPKPGTGLEPKESSAMDPDKGVEDLLTLLSAAWLVEPQLLRAVRGLLPALEADIRSEFLVRMGPATATAGWDLALLPQAQSIYSPRFQALTDEIKQKVADLVFQYHQGYGPALLSRELLRLAELGAPLAPEVREAAEELKRRLNATMHRDLASPAEADRLGLFDWSEWEQPRLSPQARSNKEEAVSWALTTRFLGLDKRETPEGMNPDHINEAMEMILPDPGLVSKWEVFRHPGRLEIQPWKPYSLKPSPGLKTGQPLGILTMRRLHLQVSVTIGPRNLSKSVLPESDRTTSIELPDFDACMLISDCMALELAPIREPLVSAGIQIKMSLQSSGWDHHGLYCRFMVQNVEFNLRWIPPGVFTMGSPEDELGRFEDEGPQHRVSILSGIWMGAAPVTQAQYLAVTGKNPSKFKNAGPDAPVEQVSWDDAVGFCTRLNQVAADLLQESGFEKLRFRLPSEAEWEYACRAGTTTALYSGPITMVGKNHAPELDPIAWYGGNSGVEYQGGYDSSDWPEKQFEHKKAGTHPVGMKKSNGWGLQDMLGNVWEWCVDHRHESYNGAPDDGVAWVDADAEKGCVRVIRGGSWYDGVERYHCAYRDGWGPGIRDVDLGFRLVLAPCSTGRPVRSLEQNREQEDLRARGRGLPCPGWSQGRRGKAQTAE